MFALEKILRCPTHHSTLTASEDRTRWVCAAGESFPVVDGIFVLLPDEADRNRLIDAAGGRAMGANATALDFYNRADAQDSYYRTELPSERAALEKALAHRNADGPVLEVGSGRGVLQGVGGDYVALDYAFTALRQYIAPTHHRVCATADALPFQNDSFSLVFTVTALEHVPKVDRAMAEIDRVLKPGGVAFIQPAWHCTRYNCEGIPVRPYSDLTLRQKWVKFTLPLRRQRHLKALATLPRRVARRLAWLAGGAKPTGLRFKRLPADYTHFWLSDSDACSRLDSHEGALFFASRAYDVLAPGPTAMKQLLFPHGPLVVRKARNDYSL